MIWEEESYKAMLQERMENEARQWVKNKQLEKNDRKND
jgi:predicted house-cleaning noncanonical NTP pyrophosphatase (MazG superfamily)